MESNVDITKICYGCLCCVAENKLFKFNIENGPLQCVFQVNKISLCYLCKRSAQKVSTFLQNVQSNQLLLENIHVLMDSTYQTMKAQINPLSNLKQVTLDCIELSDTGVDAEEAYTVFGVGFKQTMVKGEMKEEYAEPLEQLDKDFSNDEDEYPDQCLKEEDQFPLTDLMETDVKVKDMGLMSLKDLLKQSKPIVEALNEDLEQKLVNGIRNNGEEHEDPLVKDDQTICETTDVHEGLQIEKIFLTTKQCMEEREKLILDPKYQEFTYKCKYCIKGFENKQCFERHMDKHSETAGDFICEICNMRKDTSFKLARHRNYHIIRYKCTECGLIRNNRATIKEHYNAYHAHGYHQYNCPHCPKNFKRQVSLKKHIWYAHKTQGKVTCAYCHKTYAHKEVLKVHMMTRHPGDVSAVEKLKRWVCQDCGTGFKCPSHLKKHSLTHKHSKDFYCVECDKNFKSDSTLKQHLKTALAHVNYGQLPLPCQHCSKRFAIRRDLERHTNRIHLNVKPFQCDRCDKAYVNSWSLTEHKRLIHEGYKRPLKYPCPICDKAFHRNHILKSHIRTHTGERPYQCVKCPAQFSQASVLATHVKLIHLKLTRDGRPKALAIK